MGVEAGTPPELEEFTYDYDAALLPGPVPEAFTMWRYASLLPIASAAATYPLQVGGTPLLPAHRLRTDLAMASVWCKDETRSPSGSTKDRATALVLADGRSRGTNTVTCASTGNAAAATCIGAGAMGMRAVVFVPTNCDAAKIATMVHCGAHVFRVDDGYRAAINISRQAARRFGWIDRNTGTNLMTLEAKKTVAFEIWEQLGRRVPDVVVVPVGDGVTLSGIAKGFREIQACGGASRLPRLIGVQAQSCQPLVRRSMGEQAASGELDPSGTTAHGIAVVDPVCGDLALRDVARVDGSFVAADESEIAAAAGALARMVGVLAEPAAAAALAGLRVALRRNVVDRHEEVVLLVTGRAGMAQRSWADWQAPRLGEATLEELERSMQDLVNRERAAGRGDSSPP